MRLRSPLQSKRIPTTRAYGWIGAQPSAKRSGRTICNFKKEIVAIIADTIQRWRREYAMIDDEAEDDARLIVGSAHMIAQMKFTRCPADKVDRFLRTLVRSALRQ